MVFFWLRAFRCSSGAALPAVPCAAAGTGAAARQRPGGGERKAESGKSAGRPREKYLFNAEGEKARGEEAGEAGELESWREMLERTRACTHTLLSLSLSCVSTSVKRSSWGGREREGERERERRREPRAIMSDVLIRPSSLWGCGTWPCHTALLQAANTVQLRILRDSGGYPRKTRETWADWNQRSLRMCRVQLHKYKHERWSTFILRQIWQLHGHVARGPEVGKKSWHGRTCCGGKGSKGKERGQGMQDALTPRPTSRGAL